jgi:fatty acid desaturase
MNNIKRYLGILWMLLGPAAIILMIWQAYEKVGLAYKAAGMQIDEAAKANAVGLAGNTLLQWSIIIVIFLPVAIGMVLFGKYAWQGEYDHLPGSNDELRV